MQINRKQESISEQGDWISGEGREGRSKNSVGSRKKEGYCRVRLIAAASYNYVSG